MPNSKESIKRQNYFDLKRDEFMAMDEYLLSPISEMDLRRMNEGGIANIENMIAPIGMAGGGDPNKAELEGLLKSLRISLMIAEGTATPSFLGGGSSQQIRDLEKQIRQIELMLGE
jgi:thiazole synthase ThiGH ThiG subunit